LLNQATLDKLHALRLTGMAEAYQKQLDEPEARGLNFEQRFGLLVDSHWTWRENQALVRRLKKSKLSAEPCVEDINYRYPRQIDSSTVRGLTNSQWVIQHLNVLFTGPTGIGKTWLAQALAQKACRDGYSVLYRSSAKLFRDLVQARADGSLGRLLESIARTDVLLVDDFAMAPLNDDERRSSTGETTNEESMLEQTLARLLRLVRTFLLFSGPNTSFHVIEAKEYGAEGTSIGRRKRLWGGGAADSPVAPTGRDSYVSTGC
jgi:DNA replication protein DnaC